MIRIVTQTKTWLSRLTVVAVILLAATAVRADTWRGTAPFCEGECLPGEKVVKTSNCGNGGCCWTGHKVLCANANPSCAVTQTRTSCAGVIMICDNGHYVSENPPNNWVSCASYACGICFGF
jgi:hypothetical protein